MTKKKANQETPEIVNIALDIGKAVMLVALIDQTVERGAIKGDEIVNVAVLRSSLMEALRAAGVDLPIRP